MLLSVSLHGMCMSVCVSVCGVQMKKRGSVTESVQDCGVCEWECVK